MIELDKFLQEVGLSIKHHGFAEEHEWRVISTLFPDSNDTNRKYGFEWKARARNFSLVEYMAIDLTDDGLLPIREIIVGPCRDHKSAKRFVDGILRKPKMNHVRVRKSDIPYRSS